MTNLFKFFKKLKKSWHNWHNIKPSTFIKTEHNTKIIDLASDFRLQNLTVFEKWYKLEHLCPELVPNAVRFGRNSTRKNQTAQIIGNPGCYPTTALLGLAPLLKAQNDKGESLIDPYIVIDAKSGISGAGRQAKMNIIFSETSDNFSAYGVAGHRHIAEIEQGVENFLRIIIKIYNNMTFALFRTLCQ